MTYIHRLTDPTPQIGDQAVNERVKIIYTNSTAQAHQDAINAFLITLRDLTPYIVHVRTIENTVLKVTGGVLAQYATIYYSLVGDLVSPAI